MNTADYLLERGDDQDTVLIAGGAKYTYRDLRQVAARVAGELLAAGVQPSDRVGILGANSFFWVAAYLAALKLGAVAVPFATTLMPGEITAMAVFVRCRVMCVEQRHYRRLAGTIANVSSLILDEIAVQSERSAWPDTAPSGTADEDATLMFTSGTTARPRAVRVTHRNIQANTESIINYLHLARGDRMMVILPF